MFNFLSKSNKQLSDEELVSRFRNSHEKVYAGELFSRYAHLLYGLCLKYLKEPEDAKDAVMDLYEKIETELKRHHVENFRAWLFTVAKNECLMKLRKIKTMTQNRQGFEKFVKSFVENEQDEHLLNGLPEEKLFEQLMESIRQLKSEQKKCIELFFFENKSYHEITTQTGFTLNEVKSYLQNGKRNLRLLLENKKKQ